MKRISDGQDSAAAARETMRRAEEAHRAEEGRRASQQQERAAAATPAHRARPPVDHFEKSPSGAPVTAADGTRGFGGSGFDPRADIDGNGTVNILDLSRMASQYGRTGENLAADLDGNRRVDILDMARAASSYGQSVSQGMLDALHPVFHPLNQLMNVFEDNVRGVYVQLGGPIGINPLPFGHPEVADGYFVMKDGFGDPVLRGKVEVFENNWIVTVLQKDIPESLLRSYHFDLSVYLKGTDGEWAMNTQSFPLQENTLQDLIDMLKPGK
jgi:hypothetical protein